MSKRQSMSTTAHSLYQSFDQNSTCGDSSQYFSAIESDDDMDKTIENENENTEPKPVDASTIPKKRVSFIPSSTNRYSSLTQRTMNREFQKKLRDNRIAREKGVANVILKVSSTPETFECSDENKENVNDGSVNNNEPNLDLKISSKANEPMTDSLKNVVASNHIEEIILEADGSISAQMNTASVQVVAAVEEIAAIEAPIEGAVPMEGNVPTEGYIQEAVETQPPKELPVVVYPVVTRNMDSIDATEQDAINSVSETRNTIKNARQKLIEDTKKHQSRMSMNVRNTFKAQSKPPTSRKSMAPIRSIIDRANAMAAAESSTASMPGPSNTEPIARKICIGQPMRAKRRSLIATLAPTSNKRKSQGEARTASTNTQSSSRASIVPSNNSVKMQRRQSKNFIQQSNPNRKTIHNLARKSMLPKPSSSDQDAIDQVIKKSAPSSTVTSNQFQQKKAKRQTLNQIATRLAHLAIQPEAVTSTASNNSKTQVMAKLNNQCPISNFSRPKPLHISKKISATVTNETRTTVSKTTTIVSKRTSVSVSKVIPTSNVSSIPIIVPNVSSQCALLTKHASNPKIINLENSTKESIDKKESSMDSNSSRSTQDQIDFKIVKTFKCEPCKQTFAKDILYKVHMSNFHKTLSSNKKMPPPINALKCKHCDRCFVLQFALDNHLMENCTKISPIERKRHIQMAEQQKLAKSKTQNGNKKSYKSYEFNLNSNKIFNSVNLDGVSIDANNCGIDGKDLDACDGEPNKSNLFKMPTNNLGHSGIYRTPTKSIPCKICNIIFFNAVEYAQHCVDAHP